MAVEEEDLLAVQPPYMLNIAEITNQSGDTHDVTLTWKGTTDPNVWFKVKYLAMNSANLEDYTESEWFEAENRFSHKFVGLSSRNSQTLIETQYCFQVKAYMTISDDSGEESVTTRPRISVYPSEIRIDNSGGSETVRLFTSSGNSITSSVQQDGSWVAVNGNTISISPNETLFVRFARVRFSTTYEDDSGETITMSTDCVVRQDA